MELNLFEALSSIGIDYLIVLMVLAGGFFATTYLDGWTHIRIGTWKPKFSDAWKTLIVGSIFTAVYIVVLIKTSGFPKELWKQFFISYIFATSFYELLLKPITAFIKKKIGSNE
jgi:hypothetical protein